LTPLQCRCI